MIVPCEVGKANEREAGCQREEIKMKSEGR